MTNSNKISIGILIGLIISTFAVTASVYAESGAQCSDKYDGQYFDDKPSVSDDLCESGSAGGSIQGDGSESSPWKWHCYDDQGVEGEKCEAFQNLCGNGKIDAGEQCDGESGCNNSCEMDAQCGSSDGAVLESKPSKNLCSVGNASGSIEGDGTDSNPWKWHCYDLGGNADQKCTATKKVEVVEPEPEEPIIEEPAVEEPVDPIGDTEEAEEEVVEEKNSCDPSDYSDIKGYVFHDKNRNGVIDTDENPIAGVKVELFDASGKEVDEDKTNTTGRFTFRDFAPGKYTVDVKESDSALDGFFIVSEPDNKLNGEDQITLKCGSDRESLKFGYDNTGERSAQGSAGGTGGGSDRPTTLAQTGGSFWSYITSIFTR